MADGTVSDLIVDRLEDWGVSRVFGYSGDGINAFMGALRRAKDRVEFVQARHEENAAFMAVGHAKYSGQVGVVTSTQGPGAVHLLNGLYDAKLDRVPVVAIIGQQSTSVLGSGYMQEIDLPTLVKDVAAGFSQLVSTAEQLPMVLDRAFRAALTGRAPAVVIVPHDVQKEPAPEHDHEHGIVVTAPAWAAPRVLPAEADVAAAVAVLNAGSRVAMLVGQGARDARDEVIALAQALRAGIATSLLGKPFVDEELPFVAGTMGHLGTTASAFVLANCDTLLIVGSNDPWTEFYPMPGQARAVQIDIDGRAVGNRYPVEVSLVGDAAATLEALLPNLIRREGGGWRADVEDAVRRWRGITDARANTAADPVNPERPRSAPPVADRDGPAWPRCRTESSNPCWPGCRTGGPERRAAVAGAARTSRRNCRRRWRPGRRPAAVNSTRRPPLSCVVPFAAPTTVAEPPGVGPAELVVDTEDGGPPEPDEAMNGDGASVTLRDGRSVLIRPIRAGDGAALASAFAELSTRSKQLRFGSAPRTLGPDALRHLIDSVDGLDHVAFAAFDGSGRLVGVARILRYPHDPEALDIGMAVADDHQGAGLGSALSHLLATHRPRPARRIVTSVAADNPRVMSLFRAFGATTSWTTAGIVVELSD